MINFDINHILYIIQLLLKKLSNKNYEQKAISLNYLKLSENKMFNLIIMLFNIVLALIINLLFPTDNWLLFLILGTIFLALSVPKNAKYSKLIKAYKKKQTYVDELTIALNQEYTLKRFILVFPLICIGITQMLLGFSILQGEEYSSTTLNVVSIWYLINSVIFFFKFKSDTIPDHILHQETE